MPNLFSAAARLVHTSRRRGRAQSSTLHKPVSAAADARPGAPALPFESLESRVHLSVTQDANGWTVVTPDAGARVIYVSNSEGSDSNSGRSADKPVKTLGKHTVKVKLHPDVTVELNFDVVSENPIEPTAPAVEAKPEGKKGEKK